MELDPCESQPVGEGQARAQAGPLYVDREGSTHEPRWRQRRRRPARLCAQQPNPPPRLAGTGGKGSRRGRGRRPSQSNGAAAIADDTREKETVGLTPKRATARRHPQQLLREGLARAEPGQGRRGTQDARPGRAGPDPHDEISKIVTSTWPRCCPPEEHGRRRRRWSRSPVPGHHAGAEIPVPRHRPEDHHWLLPELEHAGHDRPGAGQPRGAAVDGPQRAGPRGAGRRLAPRGGANRNRRPRRPAPTETPEMKAARRLRRFTGSGPSLRDELSELVTEDPDAAANILRTGSAVQRETRTMHHRTTDSARRRSWSPASTGRRRSRCWTATDAAGRSGSATWSWSWARSIPASSSG